MEFFTSRNFVLWVAAAFFVSAPLYAAAGTTAEFNSYCADGLTRGMEVKTDCSISWTDTTTGKLYCFSTEQAKATFATDTKANIGRAELGFQAATMKAQANAMAAAHMKQAQEQMKAAQGTLNSAQMQAQGQNAAQFKQAQDQLRAAQGMMNGAQVQFNGQQGVPVTGAPAGK